MTNQVYLGVSVAAGVRSVRSDPVAFTGTLASTGHRADIE